MKEILTNIKNKYYTYQPGEFLPVFAGGELTNRREFHAYRVRWIINNREAAWYQLTHHRG